MLKACLRVLCLSGALLIAHVYAQQTKCDSTFLSPVNNDALFAGTELLITWRTNGVGPDLSLITRPFVGQYMPGYQARMGYATANMTDINNMGALRMKVPLKPSPSQLQFVLMEQYLDNAGLPDEVMLLVAGFASGGFVVRESLVLTSFHMNELALDLQWTAPRELNYASVSISIMQTVQNDDSGHDTFSLLTLASAAPVSARGFTYSFPSPLEANEV